MPALRSCGRALGMTKHVISNGGGFKIDAKKPGVRRTRLSRNQIPFRQMGIVPRRSRF